MSVNKAVTDEFDVVVIGAGPIGQNAAERARAAGLRVGLVERELVGGECSYWACVPSKALLRPVIALADVRRVDGAREAVNGSINAPGVFGRRDRYVTNWDDAGQADWVKGIWHWPHGMRSWSARGAAPPFPTCLGSPRPGRGPTARLPTAAMSPTNSPSSGAAVWASK
jgi:glycine/D-amino acid oxidase-like deaminating enzyme